MSEADYKLIHPVSYKVGDETNTVERVTLRRIKGKDLRATAHIENDMLRALKMIERLSGLDALIVDELDDDDLEALSGIIAGFTMPGPKTGSAA